MISIAWRTDVIVAATRGMTAVRPLLGVTIIAPNTILGCRWLGKVGGLLQVWLCHVFC